MKDTKTVLPTVVNGHAENKNGIHSKMKSSDMKTETQSTSNTTTTTIIGLKTNADNEDLVGGCCVCSDDQGFANNALVYCDGKGCTVACHTGNHYLDHYHFYIHCFFSMLWYCLNS